MLSMLAHLISFNFVAWVIITLLLTMLLTVVYCIFAEVVRWVLPLISHLFFTWLGGIIVSLVCSPSLKLCYARAILVRICIICNFDPLSLLKYIYNFLGYSESIVSRRPLRFLDEFWVFCCIFLEEFMCFYMFILCV
jgi:hypothetical protein